MLADRLRMSSVSSVGDGILWVYDEGIEYITIIHAYYAPGGYFAKRSDHIELRGDRLSAVTHMGTDTKIDVTGFNTIYIDWERTHPYAGQFDNVYSRLMLVDVRTGSLVGNKIHASYQRAGNAPFSRRVDSLDVSDLNGEFYIRVNLSIYAENIEVFQKIYRIWLE